MKKSILLITAIIGLFFGMTACAKKPSAEKAENNNAENKKTLVAYFSATGTTESVAKAIAKIENAELLKIQPTKEYTDEDLDWRNKSSRSSQENDNTKARPEFVKAKDNLDAYDVIYIGFPIWWNVPPRIINTFIEAYQLKGKTVIPFATSGGSDISNSEKVLKEDYPEINWEQGKLINTNNIEDIETLIKKN